MECFALLGCTALAMALVQIVISLMRRSTRVDKRLERVLEEANVSVSHVELARHGIKSVDQVPDTKDDLVKLVPSLKKGHAARLIRATLSLKKRAREAKQAAAAASESSSGDEEYESPPKPGTRAFVRMPQGYYAEGVVSGRCIGTIDEEESSEEADDDDDCVYEEQEYVHVRYAHYPRNGEGYALPHKREEGKVFKWPQYAYGHRLYTVDDDMPRKIGVGALVLYAYRQTTPCDEEGDVEVKECLWAPGKVVKYDGATRVLIKTCTRLGPHRRQRISSATLPMPSHVTPGNLKGALVVVDEGSADARVTPEHAWPLEWHRGENVDGGSDEWRKGDRVYARWRSRSAYYRGRIRRVHGNGTFEVRFDDGDVQEIVHYYDMSRARPVDESWDR